MKRAIIIFTVLIVPIFIFAIISQKKKEVTLNSEKNSETAAEIKTPMKVNFPIPVVVESSPSLVKKKNARRVLGSIPRVKLSGKNSELQLLKGVVARAQKQESVSPIGRINNFYLYPSVKNEEENVVYNSAKNQYGVLTWEIVVVGKDEAILSLAQKYGLEILKAGSMGTEYILRAPDATFFTRDLTYFQRESGILSVSPHVSYGNVKFR